MYVCAERTLYRQSASRLMYSQIYISMYMDFIALPYYFMHTNSRPFHNWIIIDDMVFKNAFVLQQWNVGMAIIYFFFICCFPSSNRFTVIHFQIDADVCNVCPDSVPLHPNQPKIAYTHQLIISLLYTAHKKIA